MDLYIYLQKRDHANTWVNGGQVPIHPASKYRDSERKGVKTPDENQLIEISGEGNKSGITDVVNQVIHNPLGTTIVNGSIYNGNQIVAKDIIYKKQYEDGVILSLSDTLSPDIFIKLDNREAVVKIIDINKLKSIIDDQIGIISDSGICLYTSTDERNHFKKHIEDSWQREYRFIWTGLSETKYVEIPQGIAIDVTHELFPNYLKL